MRPIAWVSWVMAAAGLLSGVAGYVMKGRAEDLRAESAVYRREMKAAIEALEETPSLSSALSMTPEKAQEAALKTAEGLGLNAEASLREDEGNNGVQLRLSDVSHPQVVSLILSLEQRGLPCATLSLAPDRDRGTYRSVEIELPAGRGKGR